MLIKIDGRRLSAIAAACSCVSAMAVLTGAPTPARACTTSSFSSSGGSSSGVDCVESQRAAIVGQTQREQSRENVNLVSGRISAALTIGLGSRQQAEATPQGNTIITGLSGGDGQNAASIWGTYSHSWLKNSWALLNSKTDLNTGLIGGDIKLSDNVLVGVAGTIQGADTANKAANGSLDAMTYSLTPYGAISFLNSRVVLDAMAGIGMSQTDSIRGRNTINATGNYKGDTWMAATHATYNHPIGNILLSGKLGWMSSHGHTNRFTESDNSVNRAKNTDIGELSFGTRASYTMGSFQPYLGLTYAYDPILRPADPVSTAGFATTDNLSRQQLDGLIGVNWQPTEKATISAELSNMFLRNHESNTTAMVAGRYSF